MYFVTITITFLLCFVMKGDPVELVPVDAGFEDLTPLSESLKVELHDIRQSQSFEQLFRVKGSPEIFVRRAGTLHAVFRDPRYIETSQGSVAAVPTGTVYCIGEVTSDVLSQLGVLRRGKKNTQEEVETIQEETYWQPIPPGVSHLTVTTIRFLDDESYRRSRLASFVLEVVLD